MHELAPLIHDLAIMLGVASVVVLIFQRIHQPVVLGYLVVGIIIGPYTTPHGLIVDIANIKILSELGVIFLMFSLGLEFSFHKLVKVGFSALITGLFDVSSMILIGYGLGMAMGWDYNNKLFLGAAISISSTTIIMKAIHDLDLKTKRFSEVIIGILIVEDLLAILLLVALSTIVINKTIFSIDMLFAIVKLILVVGGWFLIGYFIVPPLFRRFAKYVNQETLTILSVGLCLFLVSIAAHFHYSTALGAFIMGSILAETILIHRIEELIIPIRDIFGAVFFISVGMLINPTVFIEKWPLIFLISFTLMFGKVLVIAIGTLLTGQSINTSIRAGFGMAQIGEFSFIIATLGFSLHAIDDTLYPIIVAVSGITTFATPHMLRLSGLIGQSLENNLPDRVKYFFNSYAAWVYRTQTSSKKNKFLKTITLRMIINAIIIALIFSIIKKFFFNEIYLLVENKKYAKIICELTALLISSPFIWGMLFSYKVNQLPNYTKTTLHPVVFIISLLTLGEIIFLSIIYFHTLITTTLLALIMIVSFAIAYRHLEKSYHWFENQLIKNIKKQPSHLSRYRELAPWDTHFVEMRIEGGSRFINKTLGECQIRQLYGVNIIAIYRGHSAILAPRGHELLQDNDKIIVLGTDEQIDLFKKQVSVKSEEPETPNHLDDFILKPILLEKDHPFIGKTIRQSQIREEMNGLTVGLERGNNRILNPAPETILMIDDLLLIVSSKEISS